MNKTIVASVISGVVGFGLAAAVISGADPEIKTVEKEVPVEVEKVVEKEVEVETEVTPDVCIEALDYAEVAFGLAAEGFGYAADAIEAASMFDVAGVDEATEGMVETNDELNPLSDDYNRAATSCRAQ